MQILRRSIPSHLSQQLDGETRRTRSVYLACSSEDTRRWRTESHHAGWSSACQVHNWRSAPRIHPRL